MIKRLLLTFLMNGIFAWSLYLLGWEYWDVYAFMLIIPLVLSVALTLSAGHWAIWNQGSFSRQRFILSASFNSFFAWVCYSAAWYDMRNLPIVSGGLNVILLLAIAGVFVQWAIGSMQFGTVEKAKRDRLDAVLRDLSSEDLLRLKERLGSGSIDDGLLEEQIVGNDGEFLRH